MQGSKPSRGKTLNICRGIKMAHSIDFEIKRTKEKPQYGKMEKEELVKILNRLDEFHTSLTRILASTEPYNWPTANWCYEQFTEALYDESIWEEN